MPFQRERSESLAQLTLHPLFALALLSVLLLEFRDEALVHLPGLGHGALLLLVYTGEEGDIIQSQSISGQKQGLPFSSFKQCFS